jgi:crotonobetainyl-CoA:carnitine CoA-transferase CaiB-like acyl-CoA transferase
VADTTISEATVSETTVSERAQLLSGIRVVDLGGSVACLAATMILAETGADVVMVEPHGGSPLRSRPGFRTWGRSKRSIELDLTIQDERAQLDDLLAAADIVVHSMTPSEARSLGLDDAALATRHPHLVVSSILGWPANHADADAPVDDVLTLARLGVLDEQMACRPGPIYVRFPLGTWPATWLAVIGILSRLVSRDRTGVVGPAHTSLAQGALVPMMMHWSRAETPSDMLRRGMPKDDMRPSLFQCGDGRWIHIMPPSPDDTPLMREVFAEMGPDLVAEANARHADRAMPTYSNWGAITEAFERRTADQWLRNLWDSDVPAQEAAQFGAILADEQARANRYVVDLDDPEAGPITAAGLPLTLDPPADVRSPAPAAGADGAVSAEWTQRSNDDATSPVVAGSTRYPLEGIKVLDFGNFLAGPLGPMLLADLGATVVKVEAVTGDPMRWPDWPFAGCQRGKRAVALDIKSPASRPALDALLRWADVVHHNLRLPAARRLGLDSDSVRAVNPDAVFCHVSSYGPTGPRADWPGYDQLFQASCGWETMGAGEGNPPMWHRFGFMDHLCAMSSVAGVLMALRERHRTGRATDVAASLLGAGVLTNSETYRRADGTLADVARLDREQLKVGPGERILETRDGWIAVSAKGPDEVTALCRAVGAADADGLAAAAVRHPSSALLETIVGAGVAAAEVRRGQREPFFDDPDHRAAGLIASYSHGQWGTLEQPGALWYFANQDVRLDLAPPLLGEHTVEVLTEVGMTREDVDALVSSGAAVAHDRSTSPRTAPPR